MDQVTYFQFDSFQELRAALNKLSEIQSKTLETSTMQRALSDFASKLHSVTGTALETASIQGTFSDFASKLHSVTGTALETASIQGALSDFALKTYGATREALAAQKALSDLTSKWDVPSLSETLAQAAACFERFSTVIPDTTSPRDDMETEVDISEDFYECVEPVVDFWEQTQQSQEAEQSKTVFEKVRNRVGTLTKADVQFLVSTFLTLIGIILTVISLVTPVKLDAETSESIQSIESATEEAAEGTQQIIDLLEKQINVSERQIDLSERQADLAERQIALLQSINDSLDRLADCIDASEEADDQESEDSTLDRLQDGQD